MFYANVIANGEWQMANGKNNVPIFMIKILRMVKNAKLIIICRYYGLVVLAEGPHYAE
jgi:hypothetical protein